MKRGARLPLSHETSARAPLLLLDHPDLEGFASLRIGLVVPVLQLGQGFRVALSLARGYCTGALLAAMTAAVETATVAGWLKALPMFSSSC